MELKVPCGISGKARVVLTNSITGDVTHDTGEFENVWTDAGLASISKYVSQNSPYPGGLHYGSGVNTEPHTSVTRLKNRIGSGAVSFYADNNIGVLYDTTQCSVTRTHSITVPARGVAWTLSELGLAATQSASVDMYTYTLTKNAAGVVTPVQVSAIEIVTIYYTIQVQYPMTLPPIDVVVQGLPPTTATFTLRPDVNGFASAMVGGSDPNYEWSSFSSFSDAGLSGRVGGDNVGTKCVWPVSKANSERSHFGHVAGRSASHIFVLNPPITKNNTQVLEMEVFWQFSNATIIESPQ